MNEASMFLHFILLVMVSVDIATTKRNQALHQQTQQDIANLNERLDLWIKRGFTSTDRGLGD